MPTQRRAAAVALLAQMVTPAGTRNVISEGDLVQRVREQEGRMTRLWDVATHTQLGSPFAANALPVTGVAFGPDGGALAAGGNETVWLGSGFLWTNFADLSSRVCGLVGTGLSPAEWALYAPDLAYQDSCP